MGEIKQKRTANHLQQVLSELLRDEVDDPRLAGVTVTEVRIDRELEHANVFVAALAGEGARESVLAGLQSAQGFLRREVARRVRIRRAPVLHFHWDAGLERGERIAQLLDAIQPGETPVEATVEGVVAEDPDADELDLDADAQAPGPEEQDLDGEDGAGPGTR